MAKLSGKVALISKSGDVVTDIAVDKLAGLPRDTSVTITCEGHRTVGIHPTDHGQPDMTFVAYAGVSGFLELALVGDDASRFLGIAAGASVEIEW